MSSGPRNWFNSYKALTRSKDRNMPQAENALNTLSPSRRAALTAIGGIAAAASVGAVTAAPIASSEKPATLEDLRGLDFEAHDFQETLQILNREHALSSNTCMAERLAAGFNSKTKTELVSALRNPSNEDGDQLLDALQEAAELLKFRLSLVECAQARIFAAGASLVS
jgi:hypothetical protein